MCHTYYNKVIGELFMSDYKAFKWENPVIGNGTAICKAQPVPYLLGETDIMILLPCDDFTFGYRRSKVELIVVFEFPAQTDYLGYFSGKAVFWYFWDKHI